MLHESKYDEIIGWYIPIACKYAVGSVICVSVKPSIFLREMFLQNMHFICIQVGVFNNTNMYFYERIK